MADETRLVEYLRRVTADLHETRERLRAAESAAAEPIAVVAAGCRYPGGVRSPEDLWDLVAAGRDAITPFPPGRGWAGDGLGGFLPDAGEFDAAFFGIGPREARAMDPQQRLLLETAWETFERAGLDPSSFRGSRTGVFVGAIAQDYGPRLHEPAPGAEGYLLTGTTPSILSGRLAYTFGTEGPALTIDTACSSSLVAIHLASDALRRGECTLALAGGVTVMATPGAFIEFARTGGLAADGRCKAFGATADGTGWAEGVGLVLLARLSDALRDGHPVLAVLRGSAVNSDGASNGLTAPNRAAQERVIRAALSAADLTPSDVDVVEAHGTGTALGDPLEAAALQSVYGRDRAEPLLLGSLKSNIGHTQAAAGVGGLLKMIMAMRHGIAPRTLHADTPTTNVDWSTAAVTVLSQSRPWPEADRPRRAAVSSFGISGTNAHVIVEQGPRSELAPSGSASTVPAAATAGGASAPASTAPTAATSATTSAAISAATSALTTSAAITSASAAATSGAISAPASAATAAAPSAVTSAAPTSAAASAPNAAATSSVAPAAPTSAAAATSAAASVPAAAPAAAAARAGLSVPSGSVEIGGPPGGTNGTLVQGRGVGWAGDVVPLVVSGRSEAALRAQARALASVVEEPLPDLCWSAATTRAAFEYRAVVVGADTAELRDGLRAVADNSPAITGRADVTGRLVAVFPGQGAQWVGMAVDLMDTSAVFARKIAECERALAPHVGWSLTTVLRTGAFDRVDVVQPVLFAVMVALAELWRSYGIVPDAVVGHSQGEIAAACVAGALSLDDAAKVVALRSKAVRDVLAGTGGMVSVALSATEIQPLLGERLSLAAHNGVSSVVVSGEPEALTALVERLEGVRTRRIPVDYASHSAEVDRIRDRLRADLAGITPRRPDIPMLSTVTGDWVDATTLDVDYWYRNLREPVRFDGAVRELAGRGYHAFVECAPHPVLTTAIAETLDDETDAPTVVVGSTRRDDGSLRRVLTSLAELYVRGPQPDWAAVFPGARRVDLPTYAFQHQWYWLDTPTAGTTANRHYTVVWRSLPAANTRIEGRWLALSAGKVGDAVVDALTSQGVDVTTARDDGPLAGVLSLVALDDPDPAAATATAFTAAPDAPVWTLTMGAVSVSDAEAVASPAQAGAWGVGRVAALEQPRRWGGLIDLPVEETADLAGRLGAVLGGSEDQVAIRPTGTYGRRLAAAPETRTTPWRARDTALVTGGTGALGAHVTRWLAQQGVQHIVLAGRRGEDTPGVAALRDELAGTRVEAGENIPGTRVDVVACDVADRDAVAALLGDLAAAGRTVRTVIHAAGVGRLAPLTETDPADYPEMAAGKVAGARNLIELLDPDQLDVLVLFSSISGVWGVADHAAYAAANAQLDALASHHRATGFPVLSLAWGPWGGGGLITDDVADTLRKRGVPVLEPAAAMAEMRAALDHDGPFLAIADVDWDRFVPVFTGSRPSPLLADLPVARHLEHDPAPETRLRDRHQVLAIVRAQAAAVLGHADAAAVDPAVAFRELGFDSVAAVEFRNRLASATGLRLPATLAFNHPNAGALADWLLTQLSTSDAGPDDTAPAPRDDDDPVVIVAMSCRLPGGVDNPEDLWNLVLAGESAIDGMPGDREWHPAALFDPDPDQAGASYVTRGGFLRDAAGFDARLFGISPREAMTMDPQQRLLLESAWELFERARMAPKAVRGSRTGVFVGTGDTGHAARLRAEDAEGYLVTGAAPSVASGRIAYTFGLRGPALTVDTACSSALVAMHLAVRSLRQGECTLAVAGGATVMVDPAPFVAFSRQRALSPDGVCKSFSDDADGFALAEGVGLVLLERLSDARRNGHRVLAVVRGSAVNNDGASNGLTAPNGTAQEQVIRAALADAGVTPADVDVVEGHGTGTALGDPIEVDALTAVFGAAQRETPLLLGSLKSNIGHTQAAAGAAGVIKMVQAVNHGIAPRSIHLDAGPSSHVDWRAVDLLTDSRPWPHTGKPRLAGVSSFGISGTNAHLIVEEPPADEPTPAEAGEAGPVPWVLSGMTRQALRDSARHLMSTVDDIKQVGFSLATTRSALRHRAAVVAADLDGFRAGLRALADGVPSATVVEGVAETPGPVVFVFPGQGSQWAGMAVDLMASSPVFAARMRDCAAALAPHVDFALLDVLDDERALDRVDVVQPALFAIMVSLAEVWRSYGVEPDVVVGHSQGEIAAACVAGALSLDDAAMVVARRSRALLALSGDGGMMSVALPETDVVARLTPGLSVAVVNGPEAVVVSGDPVELAAFRDTLDGVRAKVLPVDYASHSAHVERIREALLELLAPITPRSSTITFHSTVTGGPVDTAGLDAEYWYRNLRETVRFDQAVQQMAGHTFVEVSPHPTLTTVIEQSDGIVVDSLERGDGGRDRLLRSVARLHVSGGTVDWHAVFPAAQVVDLPTYPFDRQRYWLSGPRPDHADWHYRIAWRPTEVPAARLAGTWLVLGTGDMSEAIAAAMTRAGADVVQPHDLTHLGPVAGVVILPGHDLAAVLALVKSPLDSPLWIVTNNAVATSPDEAPDPVAARMWGLGMVVGLEHPQHWRGIIDVSAPADAEAVAAILTAPGGEDQFAVRDGAVLVRRMTRATPATTSWTPRGCVLVTGGTGGLGTQVARWLTEAGADRVVLASRGGRDPGLGEKVTSVACDLADREAVRHLLDGLPDLTAVVHAAGVGQFAQPLEETDPHEAEKVLAAKADGATHLDELLAGRDLDAFVVFSSGAGVWGSAGQGLYAAANAHLDALAHRRRARGQVATAIAWGAWAGDGMAAGAVGDHLRRHGMVPMAPATAVDAMARLAGSGEPATVVADIRWDRLATAFSVARGRKLFDEIAEAQEKPAAPVPTDEHPLRRDLAALPAAERDRALLALVRDHAAVALGHDDPATISPGRAFRDLGFDSMIAVRLRNALVTATGVPLRPGIAFDHPNATALAEHLRDQLFGASGDDDLDRLATVLADPGLDAGHRRHLADRLRRLLSTVEDRPAVTLDEASDEELFNLVDHDLGVS